jgi:hypothetical protein
MNSFYNEIIHYLSKKNKKLMLLLPANIFLHTHIETTKLHITEHRIKREGIKSPQILKCHIAFSSLGQIRCYKNMQPP